MFTILDYQTQGLIQGGFGKKFQFSRVFEEKNPKTPLSGYASD